MFRAHYPRVTHPFAAFHHHSLRSGGFSLDLHVLSTPPAFVLSQDQTLRRDFDSLNFSVRTTNDCSSKASLAEFISLWNVSYVKGPLTRVSVTRVHWSPNQKHKRVSDRQAHYSVLKVRCFFSRHNKTPVRTATGEQPCNLDLLVQVPNRQLSCLFGGRPSGRRASEAGFQRSAVNTACVIYQASRLRFNPYLGGLQACLPRV